MSGMSESRAPRTREKIVAKVRYVNPVWKERGEAPRIGSRESRRAATSFHDVEITDVRNRVASGEADLDKSGFTMDGNVTMVENFRDNEEVSRVYHEEMKNLICRVTGAQSAYVFCLLYTSPSPRD